MRDDVLDRSMQFGFKSTSVTMDLRWFETHCARRVSRISLYRHLGHPVRCPGADEAVVGRSSRLQHTVWLEMYFSDTKPKKLAGTHCAQPMVSLRLHQQRELPNFHPRAGEAAAGWNSRSQHAVRLEMYISVAKVKKFAGNSLYSASFAITFAPATRTSSSSFLSRRKSCGMTFLIAARNSA